MTAEPFLRLLLTFCVAILTDFATFVPMEVQAGAWGSGSLWGIFEMVIMGL